MEDRTHMSDGSSVSGSDYNDVDRDIATDEDGDVSLEQELDDTDAAVATTTDEMSIFEPANGENSLVDSIDRQHDSERDEVNQRRATSSSAPRTRAIEVILKPPTDPDSYQRISVSPMMSEVGSTDESSYDSERATYADVMRYKVRRTAARNSQQSSSMNGRSSSKRQRSEDAYEESGSEFGPISKRRKRRGVARNIRRSSRQASRQTSADLYPEESDFDESRSQFIDLAEGESEEEMGRSAAKSKRAGSSSRVAQPTKTRKLVPRKRVTIGSDDELAQDDDDLFVPIVRSDLALHEPRKSRTSKRRRPTVKPTVITRRDDSDSSIEFEPARRSTRSNKNSRNMRDPELDEFEVVEERPPRVKRHVATKETFRLLDPDSPFRSMHSETCESCLTEPGTKNPLIHCQGCSFSYHKACLGPKTVRDHRITKLGDENFVFQCRFCVQDQKKKSVRAPNYTICQTCKVPGASCAEFSSKKTPRQEEKARDENGGIDPITTVDPLLVDNADNVLFRCTNCKRAYHFEHLPELSDETAADQDLGLRMNRLAEYSMAGWSCKDCTDIKSKLHTLVAWRPVDPATYVEGQTNDDYEEDNVEYLVQWAGRSHFHDTWMPGPWVFGVAPPATRTAFHKRESSTYPKMDKAAAIEEEWLLPDVLLSIKYRTRIRTSNKAEDMDRIDDITSVFVKFQGLTYEDAVWDEPPPRDSGAPWEAFLAAYDEYLNGKYFVSVSDSKMRERIALYRTLDFGKDCELKSQPAHLKKGKLMEYQIEGVNFLLYNFHQQQNVILADEMGLGKTVQIVALISALAQSQPRCWPFLIVVPNATCPNWRRELKQWAPDLRVVTYHGGKVAQDLAYKHELYPDGRGGGMKAHVVIMSFEAAANVDNVFRGVRWVGLIVDEGQRLKNEETLLYKSLKDMNIPCRILLTGTPLQNNKRELFNLLQFIDTKRNAEELDAKYSELTKENLPELHSLIRPYFLRRTKRQVLKFLPPMAQIILPVTMTVVQEKLSKSIMARNPELIRAIISSSKVKAAERKGMRNILSDLRQCLCHPFCFSSEVEDKTADPVQMHRNLVEASPKLLLLELMLPKLKERGHRVLIFSQFLHSLTIIEDFLSGMNMTYSRIDGTVSGQEKQKRIDAYNAPDSPLFAMLLSTRAGGVGINLATADTVIIYDPDFNPHQDIQALSRAHRIGQKRKVLCFQLMTKSTIEEKIMQVGRKKMALDHALIESMDATEEVSEDLESILKHGAAALFGDEVKDKIEYDDASVDKLLDRSQIENTDTGDDDSAEAQFSFARVWATDRGDLASNSEDSEQNMSAETRTSIWENILREREAAHQRELASKMQVYGRGARRRGAGGTQNVDYQTDQPQEVGSGGSEIDIDDEYIDPHEMEEDNSEGDLDDAATVEMIIGSDIVKAAKATVDQTRREPSRITRNSSGSVLPRPSRNAHNKLGPRPLPLQTIPPRTTQLPGVHAPPYAPQFSGPGVTGPMYPPAAYDPVVPAQPTVIRHNPQAPQAPQATRAPIPVQLPSGYISPDGLIGGGNPCALCYRQHSLKNPCVDLHSELSLRMALDRLRSGNGPAIQDARNFLLRRLQIVSNRGLGPN
ncbi:PHD/FYVE-zinc-finger like domain-containing protein [Xylaria sp. CBS 124048]|nr:PHD/FYVE-zinc-finger like domain-containing protein [Xylaria sp. CBS 124048]